MIVSTTSTMAIQPKFFDELNVDIKKIHQEGFKVHEVALTMTYSPFRKKQDGETLGCYKITEDKMTCKILKSSLLGTDEAADLFTSQSENKTLEMLKRILGEEPACELLEIEYKYTIKSQLETETKTDNRTTNVGGKITIGSKLLKQLQTSFQSLPLEQRALPAPAFNAEKILLLSEMH